MISKLKFIAPALFFLVFSCSEERKFPPLNSEKIALNNLTLKSALISTKASQTAKAEADGNFDVELNSLKNYVGYYAERDEKFDLKTFEGKWAEVQQKVIKTNLYFGQLKSWIEINGFLIELTGKAKYAEEMERIALSGIDSSLSAQTGEIEKLIAPYIFTRDLDNVFVNLFVNSALEFEHSLFGTVKIEQETDYPQSGRALVKFSLEDKKYMELNVRIPVWAREATVTVKKVKYVANAGTYCKIAKKWKDGDVVEIEFHSNGAGTK